jgi:hypothetical protein
LPDYAATGVKAQAFVLVLFQMSMPDDQIMQQYQMCTWQSWHGAYDTRGFDRLWAAFAFDFCVSYAKIVIYHFNRGRQRSETSRSTSGRG